MTKDKDIEALHRTTGAHLDWLLEIWRAHLKSQRPEPQHREVEHWQALKAECDKSLVRLHDLNVLLSAQHAALTRHVTHAGQQCENASNTDPATEAGKLIDIVLEFRN